MGAPTVVLELLPGEVQHSAAVKALKDLYEVPDFDENDPLQCLGKNMDSDSVFLMCYNGLVFGSYC